MLISISLNWLNIAATVLAVTQVSSESFSVKKRKSFFWQTEAFMTNS